MDWFSFIAGALTGWIVEWLIDLFYWRRKQSSWANDQTRLQGDLEAANSNLSTLQGELDHARVQIAALNNQLNPANADKQALTDQLNGDLAASRAEVAALRARLERALADNQVLQAENSTRGTHKHELETDAAAAAPKPESDDLTIIEGIGPKIAELLNQHGIYTFAKLANTSVPDLKTVIRSAGSRFQTANPETWPRQAQYAANRDWPRLDAFKAQLQGGVRRLVLEPQDDLAVLEGVGPKIAEILHQNGIKTFAQLARMEPARLRLILEEAGPAYRIVDPTSWPEQANWAAVGNWGRLQALRDKLDAGRRPQ